MSLLNIFQAFLVGIACGMSFEPCPEGISSNKRRTSNTRCHLIGVAPFHIQVRISATPQNAAPIKNLAIN